MHSIMFDKSNNVLMWIKDISIPIIVLLLFAAPFVQIYFIQYSPDMTWAKYAILIVMALTLGILLSIFTHDVWSYYHSKQNEYISKFMGLVTTFCMAINISVISYMLYILGVLTFIPSDEVVEISNQAIENRIQKENELYLAFSSASKSLNSIKETSLKFNNSKYNLDVLASKNGDCSWKIEIGSITVPIGYVSATNYFVWLINNCGNIRYAVENHITHQAYNGVFMPLSMSMETVSKRWIQDIFKAQADFIKNETIERIKSEKKYPIRITQFIYATLLGVVGIDVSVFTSSKEDHTIYVTNLIRFIFTIFCIFLLSPRTSSMSKHRQP